MKSTNPAGFLSNAVSFSAGGNLWSLSVNQVTALLPAPLSGSGTPPNLLIATILTEDGSFNY